MLNTTNKNRKMLQRLTVTAILAALTVMFQMISTVSAALLSVSITLSLVPIVFGAILYGPATGTVLGLVLGITIIAIDPTAQSMMAMGGVTNPLYLIVTVCLCLLKSSVAGLISGLAARILQKKERPRLAAFTAVFLCPTVNSGIFALFVPIFFYDMIASWAQAAEASNILAFFLLMVVGFNYALELAINLVLTPALLRVHDVAKKKLS